MEENDIEKFSEIMTGLQEIFVPEKPISETKIELYFRHFQDVTIQEFTIACNAVLHSKRISTFPLPAEIRECITGDKPLQAWLMAREAAAIHGFQFSIKFKDPVIHSVIQVMGGWAKFCFIPSDDQLTWVQKEFERLYKLMSARGEHPEFVQGAYDKENHFVDYEAWELIEGSNKNMRKQIKSC